MANVNVTYADLETTAAKIDNGRDQILGVLNELSGAVDTLVSSGFQTDQASGAYNDEFDQYKASTDTAVQALERFSTFLRTAASTLGDTDSGLAGGIRS